MSWIVLGCSKFARRRVFPALASFVDVIHVASQRASEAELAAIPKLGKTFRDYEQALAEPGVVYISLTNDAHAQWAERALELGHHVVVDKPAFIDLPTAERLVAVAKRRGLVLAEATSWPFHPQLELVRGAFAEAGSAPLLATAQFLAPIPADNIRMQRALGGGALLDIGPYAASFGRVVFGGEPTSVYARVHSRNAEVDTAFSVLIEYGEGRAVVGHFGFTTEYRSWIHLGGPGCSVDAHGMFSTPPDVETEITIRRRDVVTTTKAPAAFALQRFLAAVTEAIARGDSDTFANMLLADARVREALASHA